MFSLGNTPTGSGSSLTGRASFATNLTATQNVAYTISNILGSDYASWVDSAYL